MGAPCMRTKMVHPKGFEFELKVTRILANAHSTHRYEIEFGRFFQLVDKGDGY